MKNRVLLTVLLAQMMGVASLAKTCVDQGEVLIPQSARTVKKEISSYCYQLTPLEFISANCQKQTCRALEYQEIDSKKVAFSEFGTPGSRVCVHLGGRSQVIIVTLGGRRVRLDRCFFSNDGSFVDLGTLWRHHMAPPKIIEVSPAQNRKSGSRK